MKVSLLNNNYFRINTNAQNFFQSPRRFLIFNNGNNLNNLNNYHSNSDSMFGDEDEDNLNEHFYPFQLGSNMEEVCDNLGYIINVEK